MQKEPRGEEYARKTFAVLGLQFKIKLRRLAGHFLDLAEIVGGRLLQNDAAYDV